MDLKKFNIYYILIALFSLLIVFILLLIFVKKTSNEIIFINHTRFNVYWNLTPFTDIGCKISGNYLKCPSNFSKRFNCVRFIYYPKKYEYLGGLTPNYPIIVCVSNSSGIVNVSCSRKLYLKYIIYKNNKFIEINNTKDFIRTFAPVESKEEALAFVISLTFSYPIFNITLPSRDEVEILTNKIEGTFVKKIEEGYLVHVFTYDLCGCGHHPLYTVNYLVTRDGNISLISKKPIWQYKYTICVI